MCIRDREYAGEERVAKLPRIQIIFDDGMTRGKVIIGNSIRHHKLLEDMNTSSALGKYIVSEQYFSDDMNTYVYEFELAETDQLAFKNYKDFQLLCSKQENGTLFIDDRNRVPLHLSLIHIAKDRIHLLLLHQMFRRGCYPFPVQLLYQ